MKAIESGATATVEYSSGLQISGTFTDVLIFSGRPIYINTSGPTTLNFKNKVIKGEGKESHADGYGSPIGKIKGCLKPSRFLSDIELSQIGIEKDKECEFEFESGIKVSGILSRILRKEDVLILLSFDKCTVKHNRKTLFEPTWGRYDMAIGESIISAFSGPADADGFNLKAEVANEKTQKIEYDEQTSKIQSIYTSITEIDFLEKDAGERLTRLFEDYEEIEQEDWLLLTEMYNNSKKHLSLSSISKRILEKIKSIKQEKPNLKQLIEFGII
jgi:phenylalanine-4-hydroxylase